MVLSCQLGLNYDKGPADNEGRAALCWYVNNPVLSTSAVKHYSGAILMHVLSIILYGTLNHGYVSIYVHRIKIVMNLSQSRSHLSLRVESKQISFTCSWAESARTQYMFDPQNTPSKCLQLKSNG